jgi:putative transposase
LQFAPRTYYAIKARPLSARVLRDVELKPLIARMHRKNFGVYGGRQGLGAAEPRRRPGRPLHRRPPDARAWAAWRRAWQAEVTTVAGNAADRPRDLVDRRFSACAPKGLWVADLTYVRTWSGFVYVAFITDVYSRMIVGWQASRSLRSDLALDALEQAI